MKYYQQGDVLIKPVKGIPNIKTKKKLKTKVLVEGEETGHAHRITSGKHELYAIGQTIYLQALAEVTVKHEEHEPIILPKGTYKIDQVREVDHFKDQVRRVVD